MYYFKWPSLQSDLVDINLDGEYHILIEHEFPLLFITYQDNQYYLHYLIDKSSDTRRFILMPIGRMKLRALVTKGISLYDCIKAQSLRVYDLNSNDEVVLTGKINFDDIDINALPKEEAYLPAISNNIIDVLFGQENNKELVFILEGDKVTSNSIPFDDLSKFLSKTQKVVTDSANFYCEEKAINNSINSEMNVIATNAASFAINSKVIDKNVLNAIEEVIPIYTNKFINLTFEEIYDILDILPTDLSQSLFDYYKFISKNNYESIIKIKNKSLYLNKEYVIKIKENINGANYIRKETFTSKGYLVGGNVITSFFYFLNAEDNKAIKGHFSKDYIETHAPRITLDRKKLWKAKIELSIEYKFSEFKKIYEILDLEEISQT